MTPRPKICCIIVAAGKGLRFGAALPKQFCDLDGRPVLMTTIERMRTALPEADMRLVISDGYAGLWESMCSRHGFASPAIVAGGDTRWQSVRNAIDTIDCRTTDMIFVHDGARPLVTADVTGRLIKALENGAPGAVPCIPLTDSIRQINSDGSSRAVDRSGFMAVQTPQAFPAQLLRKCYDLPFSPVMTDDASVVEMAGHCGIAVVEGSPRTLKITTPTDLAVVKDIIEHER